LSLKIFSLSNDTSELFRQYFKIRIYSAPGELTIYIITGLFVGLQKTKISSLAVGFFSILNIILSIIFVTKYDLNIKGVAYGTLISAAFTSLIFLVYTFWYLNKISIINIDIRKLLNFKRIKEIFNINFNIFVRTILLTFSFLWFTYLGSQIGEKFVAANAILVNLVFLSAFILDAYAFSTEGIVGYSLGKKDFKLFKSILKNSFILSSITGLIISILYLIIHEKIIFLMTDIYTIRILSLDYSIWLIIIPFISSFCFQFDGIFIGASQTKELKNAMIFSVFLYLIISSILVDYFSNTGIWISLCIFMILRALSLYYFLDRIYLRFKK
jgi:MATE family multidrug resistance protein